MMSRNVNPMGRGARGVHAGRGFTLVEVITTVVVLALISGAASRVLFQAFGALDSATTRADLSSQLASAMERVTSELHNIGIKAASNPPVPDISACTASAITFSNGLASRTIDLSGTTLRVSGDAKANATLATGVTVFTIQTFDKSNAALPASPSAAQIDTIRRIQITITATRNGLTETIRAKVFIRSMAIGSGSA